MSATVSQRLPNLRKATQDQLQAFINSLETQLKHERDDLLSLSSSGDPCSLDVVASRLTALMRDCASRTLPLRGNAPFRSKHMQRLQAQRKALTRLLQLSSALIDSAHPSRMR
jgi:hypothetical protein